VNKFRICSDEPLLAHVKRHRCHRDVVVGLPPSKKRKCFDEKASNFFTASYALVRASQRTLQDAIFKVHGATIRQGMRECLSQLDEAVLNACIDEGAPELGKETAIVVPYELVMTATSTLLKLLPHSAPEDCHIVLACMTSINEALAT
jgi:hypothetical protein